MVEEGQTEKEAQGRGCKGDLHANSEIATMVAQGQTEREIERGSNCGSTEVESHTGNEDAARLLP